jgi:hypothetical protein
MAWHESLTLDFLFSKIFLKKSSTSILVPGKKKAQNQGYA